MSKMIASSLSFHCMICFEQFDSHTIYPVVLPCSHTYICVVCATRIEKCMECRTSLFTTTEIDEYHPQDGDGNAAGTSSSRSGRSQARSTVSYSAARYGRRLNHGRIESGLNNNTGRTPSSFNQKRTKVRLPLPKNVVLISLIEASNMAKESAKNQEVLKASFSAGYGYGRNDMDEEENQILLGADIATSSCGTYAVSTRNGLKIVQNIATNSASGNNRGDDNIERDGIDFDDSLKVTVDDIVHHSTFGGNNTFPNHREGRDDDSNKSTGSTSGIQLGYGDRIQVVAIVQDNWAKLSRGYGYVHFPRSSDLIKVGGVLDKACSMEAMIYSLSYGRSKLARAKVTLENDALDLMSKLQETLLTEEDLTVIGAETFHRTEEAAFSKDVAVAPSESFEIEGKDVRDIMRERGQSFDIDRQQGNDTIRRDKKRVDINMSTIKKGPPRKPKPEERVHPVKQQSPVALGFFDYAMSALGSMVSTDGDDDSLGDRMLSWNFRLPNLNSDGVSPNAMVRGAQEWRRRNGVEESRLADVDFRTGMSGHRGVCRYNHDNYNEFESGQGDDKSLKSTYSMQSQSSQLPKMSDHCGLTTPKRCNPRSKRSSLDWSRLHSS